MKLIKTCKTANARMFWNSSLRSPLTTCCRAFARVNRRGPRPCGAQLGADRGQCDARLWGPAPIRCKKRMCFLVNSARRRRKFFEGPGVHVRPCGDLSRTCSGRVLRPGDPRRIEDRLLNERKDGAAVHAVSQCEVVLLLLVLLTF